MAANLYHFLHILGNIDGFNGPNTIQYFVCHKATSSEGNTFEYYTTYFKKGNRHVACNIKLFVKVEVMNYYVKVCLVTMLYLHANQ